MRLQSGIAAEAQLPELLEAAELDHRSGGDSSDFRVSLLRVVFDRFAASSLRLWELRSGDRVILSAELGDTEGRDPLRISREAGVGIVRRLPAAEMTGDPAFGCHLLAVEVGDGFRLALELQIPDQYVDHQLLLDVGEVLADLHRRSLVSEVVRKADRDPVLQQILLLLHADLDENRIANTLASDVAEFLNCRRISVARRQSRHTWQLLATTAVSEPDPRSDVVRQLCFQIQSAAERAGRSNAADGEDRADSQAAATGSRPDGSQPVVRPLATADSGATAGGWASAKWAVVFEFMDPQNNQSEQSGLDLICRHASKALENCGRLQSRSALRGIRQRIGSLSGLRLMSILTAAFVVAIWILLRPVELLIEVPGQLVPAERRFVFAPDHGLVTDLFVEDGTRVQSGDVLCVLRSDDLEFQQESVRGDLASARARLAALESLRGDRTVSQPSLLSAEQAELKEKVASLDLQQRMLQNRIAQLTVYAPIQGQVSGERIRETLSGRPVARGQYLFEVADAEGLWEIELRIAESDARHVLAARQGAEERLKISFVLETAPERSLSTEIQAISAATEVDSRGMLSTWATAAFPVNERVEKRPGAGVIASVHCGTHTAGFVYFRRLIEIIQRRL